MTTSMLSCASCGTVSPASHNFCSHCGAALHTTPCSFCGALNPVNVVVCESCGYSDRAKGSRPFPRQPDERKFVTALFADIKGSVDLLSQRDIEEARHLIDSVILQVSSLIRRYEGTVIDTVGDGVFAVFGAPRSLEGHPRAAINAALEIQEQMRLNNNEESLFSDLQLRIGIHTGDVIWRMLQVGRELRHLPVGQSVNQASRLQSVAEVGSVLIGDSTYELVKDYFSFNPVPNLQLKGIPGPVVAYNVVKPSEVFRHLQISIKRGLSPLVGRERELQILMDCLDGLRTGKGRAVLLVSDAGGGKSRLLHEVTKSLSSQYSVIEAFCISHMQSSPWHAVIQLIRQLVELSPGMHNEQVKQLVRAKLLALDPHLEKDIPTILSLLDLDDRTITPAIIDPSVRKNKYISLLLRLLAFQAKTQPLVVIIEDLHWLDSQSTDAVDAILTLISEHPIFLLCTTRPEGIKAAWRSQWEPILALENLDDHASRALITNLVPGDDLQEELIHQIQIKTQGNPFFIEEIIRSIRSADSQALARKESTVDVMAMPSSIKMAIAERIDRLSHKAKEYLQLLAVVGIKCRVFLFTKLIAEPHDSVVDVLSGLQELGFVIRSKLDNQLYVQFGHVLTQEVAYSSLLSDARASLHEYIADTMISEFGEQLQEILPELAHHYQHSFNDQKAIEHLRLAGESAIQRSAHQEAQNYLNIGLVRLDKSTKISDRSPYLSHLWLSMGVSLQVTHGYAAEEVKTAYENAVQYSEKAKVSDLLLAALRGYGIFNIVRANYAEASRIAERLKQFAQGDPAFALEHLILSGLASSYRGDIEKGAESYRKGLSISAKPAHSTTIQYSGYSPGICYSYYALNALFAGRLRLAKKHVLQGLQVAIASKIPIAAAQSRGMYAHVLFCLREFELAEQENQANIAFSEEFGFAYWSLLARLLNTWIRGQQRQEDCCLDEFQAYVTAYRNSGALIGVPWFLNLYAELLAQFGRRQEALWVLGESEGIAAMTQERFFLVDTLRLKGEMLEALAPHTVSGEATAAYRAALQLAREQGTWLLGLRAALRLARVLQRQGALEAAKALLTEHYRKISWIACPDHRQARALGQELALEL